MALWNDKKWGGFKWGNSVPADSDIALLRAVVGGYTSWLPAPADTAPNGGDPTTGTAVYRHATTHIYLMNENDWTNEVEFVGIVTGSRTSQLQGPIQQDTLQFTLYDPTDYYTDGEGALLLFDGNLVRIEMEITSPGGTIVAPLGVYRLIGFPQVTKVRGSNLLTVNGVEWFRDRLSNPYSKGTCETPVPAFVTSGPDGQPRAPGDPAVTSPEDAPARAALSSGTSWPTTYTDLSMEIYQSITCDEAFQAWAAEQFTNQVTYDYDDGEGVQQIWLYAPFMAAAAAVWLMLTGSIFAHDRMIIDRNLKDPFGGFFTTGSGQPSASTTLGADFSVKQPEWRDILAQIVNYTPYQVVLDGTGKLHIRNPGGRYVTPFVVSCEDGVGGTIPLPVETLDHTTAQPEFTTTERYQQVSSQSAASSGSIVNPGYFVLRSRSKVPPRFNKFPRREVIITDTVNPTPVDDSGGAVITEFITAPPTTEDGTSIPRMLEIMQAADTVTITMDSAFPYIKLQDEIKIQTPGCRGFYTVKSITQPFDTGAMTLQLAWRDDH